MRPRPQRAVAARASAFLLATLLTSPAFAQGKDADADAERLFREGQKLLEERRYGEACPKFEAAYAKDRQLGTLLNLAFCHKEQGSIWYAWLEFREAEVKAGEMKRIDRRDFAHERLTELEKSLPKVILDNPKKLALTDVLVEEKRVPEAERGAPFAAEQGQRKFTFKAKGKKSATVLVTIGASLHKPQRVPVPEMEDGEDEPPVVAKEPAPAPTPPPEPQVKVVRVATPSSSQRTFGFVAIGVAGTAFIVGGVAGFLTLTNGCANNPIHDADPKACTSDARSSADTTGLVSTVGFALSGAAAITGIVLLATAPSQESSSASAEVRVGPGWAGVVGRF